MDLTSKTEGDCKDLHEALDNCQSRLTAAISKKQEIRHDLGKILELLIDRLKDIKIDIRGRMDEDDMKLAQMKSNLESLDKTRTSTETFQSVQAKIEATVKFIEHEERVMETSSKIRDMLNQISTQISALLDLTNGQKATVLNSALPTPVSAASSAPPLGEPTVDTANKTKPSISPLHHRPANSYACLIM